MKQLLMHAMEEIRRLRHDNEILRAKVEVMDLFALVLNTTPNRQRVGEGEDVAWFLQKEIQELENAERKSA